MKIVVEMSDDNQKRELSITDGTVTFNKKNRFMMNQEMLHNWITQSFDTWLTLKENQKRAEGDEDGLSPYRDKVTGYITKGAWAVDDSQIVELIGRKVYTDGEDKTIVRIEDVKSDM